MRARQKHAKMIHSVGGDGGVVTRSRCDAEDRGALLRIEKSVRRLRKQTRNEKKQNGEPRVAVTVPV